MRGGGGEGGRAEAYEDPGRLERMNEGLDVQKIKG